MKYLAKLDYTTYRGYLVRVPSFIGSTFIGNTTGTTHTVYFSIKDYCGWVSCKKAAVNYIYKYLKKHKALRLLVGKATDTYKMKCNSNNVSGVLGVVTVFGTDKEPTYDAYQARYSKQLKQLTAHFSIRKHGLEGAFIKSCRIRYKHKGTLIIVDTEVLPCIPDVPYKVVCYG